MDRIEFLTPAEFCPNTASIPNQYEDAGFYNIDFTNKKELKKFLIKYLEEFKYENCDSLFLYPGDLAFKILIAIYREVGSRITVDHYRLYDWPVYSAYIKSLGYKADSHLIDDLFDVKFVFIYDLVFNNKEGLIYFSSMMDYCYSNGMKIFIASRNEKVMDALDDNTKQLIGSKVFQVKIND